jgi:NagD protein
LIGTNPDLTVDHVQNGQHMILPGGGALIAPFSAATQTEPVIIGKPEPLLFQMALNDLQLAPEDCLMIGDRPDTDIHGAALLGIRTALVRTGRFSSKHCYPNNLKKPDWDGNNLTELAEALGL